MKKLLKRLEGIYTAAMFAESGEFDTAREILGEERRPRKVNSIPLTYRLRKELRARAPGMER